MIFNEEARARRAMIEELHAKHTWERVRRTAEELARTILDSVDLNRVAPQDLVKDLCELVIRVEGDALNQSWETVEREIKALAVEGAQAELVGQKTK